MIWVAALLVGYLVGSINPAAIIARVRRIDYRAVGSGNPGATNIGRALGRRTGVVVGLLDVLKGFLPAFLFGLSGGDVAVAEVAGLSAVIGHITSPFLKGHGGKGVATSGGAILAIEPIWLVPILLVFGIVLKLSGKMGLASVAGGITLVPAALVWHTEVSEVYFASVMAALVVVRHRQNIREALLQWRGR